MSILEVKGVKKTDELLRLFGKINRATSNTLTILATGGDRR